MFLDYVKNNFPNIKTNFFGYKGSQPVWELILRGDNKIPISLNLSRKPHLKYYSSDRISQYLGNGSCLFVDINSNLDDLFNNDEVVFFDGMNLDDFGKKVDYYSKNHTEAKKIAKRMGKGS